MRKSLSSGNEKHNYDHGIATDVIASGGTPGILVFPSVGFIVVGAFIFMRFIAIGQIPNIMATFVSRLSLFPYVLFAVIVILYIVLGKFLEIISAVLFTAPIIYPLIIHMGLDTINLNLYHYVHDLA